MRAMAERKALCRLGGFVQFDDACLCGERNHCKTYGGALGKCRINGMLVKPGHARHHTASAWYHFDRGFHMAAMLMRLMNGTSLARSGLEEVCGLSETFMAERRNLITFAPQDASMLLVVQRRPVPVVGVYIMRLLCEEYAMAAVLFCEVGMN
jgi:hypothetical protein